MRANDAAAPLRRICDLAGFTASFRRCAQHQSGARGRVFFIFVMGVKHINIPIIAQQACGLFNETFKYAHADGKIARLDQRYRLAGRQLKLCLRRENIPLCL